MDEDADKLPVAIELSILFFLLFGEEKSNLQIRNLILKSRNKPLTFLLCASRLASNPHHSLQVEENSSYVSTDLTETSHALAMSAANLSSFFHDDPAH